MARKKKSKARAASAGRYAIWATVSAEGPAACTPRVRRAPKMRPDEHRGASLIRVGLPETAFVRFFPSVSAARKYAAKTACFRAGHQEGMEDCRKPPVKLTVF